KVEVNVLLPIPMVPFATVVGAPRLLVALPPETLLIDVTLIIIPTPGILEPPAMSVLPVYLLGPPRMMVPPLLPLKVKVPLPLIAPFSVSEAVVSPLFRMLELNVPRYQGPVQTTGVKAAEPKFTKPPVKFVQVLGRVIVSGLPDEPP